MTKDLNRGISNIEYNLLNLPQQVDILSLAEEERNAYSYSADGVKLRVVKKYNSNFNTSPVIGSAVNVSSMNVTKTTDYVEKKIFENNALDRILVDGGYIKDGVDHFYETDHLGDNRTVINQSGTVTGRNDYYPFGMQMAHNAPNLGILVRIGDEPNAFKFSGKELDVMGGLNLYDFSARSQDPALGRFTTVDPLAEDTPWLSPYVYCSDNPINRVDPDGKSDFDKVIGFVAAFVDNTFGGNTNIRFHVANHVTDPKDFNTGLTAGDVASVVVGGAEAAGGSGMIEGGTTAVTLGTVGLAAGGTGTVAIVGGSATAATGTALVGHGAVMMTQGSKNLAQSKGHLPEEDNSNGNSKSSTKAQHNYDIKNTQTGKVVKTGVSGGKETKTGESYRGNSQANKWNKQEGTPGRYKFQITNREPAGQGARQKALNYEKARANQLRSEGQLKDQTKHQIP
ncbi:MAG: RHS repeat-associated core domain-containing protein [Dysgonamonadaceae bacterium]